MLAPAGGWPQLRAAVRNGADAVYFGLAAGLNARRRASNFAVQELHEVMAYLKSHQVKAYVTLNTLVFDHELFDSESWRKGGWRGPSTACGSWRRPRWMRSSCKMWGWPWRLALGRQGLNLGKRCKKVAQNCERM